MEFERNPAQPVGAISAAHCAIQLRYALVRRNALRLLRPTPGTRRIASFDDRNMLRGTARRGSVKARVVRDLDLPPERAKTRALIERQRGGMI